MLRYVMLCYVCMYGMLCMYVCCVMSVDVLYLCALCVYVMFVWMHDMYGIGSMYVDYVSRYYKMCYVCMCDPYTYVVECVRYVCLLCMYVMCRMYESFCVYFVCVMCVCMLCTYVRYVCMYVVYVCTRCMCVC